MIPYGHQCIEEDDIAAVVAVLRGDWLTQGPTIAEFEDALADAVGARHAVVFSNGTAGLHAAAAAAGLGPADLVATSGLSFVASANCARYVGASVTFVDIEPSTLNLDPAGVPSAATALVAVHYAGLSVDLGRLVNRPRVIIEDAAHALGAVTPDGPVGNCARSDMCVFSFHPVKTITTGEGGAVTTNSAELAAKLRRFRNHGIVPKPEGGPWYYEVDDVGYNLRLTDIQAALGVSQLGKLDRFVAERNRLADRYRAALAGLPVELPPAAPTGCRHAYHLFPIRVANRRVVFEHLRSAGVGVQVHYVPIYRHPLYRDASRSGCYPATDAAYDRLISLPLHPSLDENDQDRVVEELAAALCR